MTKLRPADFPVGLRGTATGSLCTDDSVIELVRRERQQRGDARALDRVLQLPLVQRARPGDAPRKDLPALRDELLQRLQVLVVDVLDLLHAELADALAAVEELLLPALLPSGAAGGRAATRSGTTRSHRCHIVSPLLRRRRFFRRRCGCGCRCRRRLRGGRERGRRADALLLRVLLGELLGAFVLEVRAHDHVAQDAVGVFHPPVELREQAVALEDEEVVVALVELLDGIGETAPAPRFFMRELRARPLGDALELTDEIRGFLLRNLRREDEQDFVSPHDSSFWPSGVPRRGTQGAGRL